LEDRTIVYLTKVGDEDKKIISLYELVTDVEKPHGNHAEISQADARVAFGIKTQYTLLSPGKAKTTMTRAEAVAAFGTSRVIQGASMRENEYGNVLFADFFFFVTGFHGTHVFSGVLLNIIVFVNVIMGTYKQRGHYEMVEKVGLYWHFVDLVWVFVFTFFYLV
jgi:cytochrome c oxidase subunit 3